MRFQGIGHECSASDLFLMICKAIEKGETLISKYEILNSDLWSRILAKRDNFKNPMLKIQDWFNLELDAWCLVLEFCP